MATGEGGTEARGVREQLEARRAALAGIARELAATDDFEQLFAVIGERVCRLLQVDSAALVLVEGDELVLRASYGFEEEIRARPPRKIAESRVGRVVLTRKPHASTDMTADPHWRDSLVVTRFGYRAILEVPLVLRQEVVAVIAALHKSPRVFSAEDAALLTELAAHTTVALERASLLRDLRARLRETETLLTVSQAVSSAPDLTEALRRVTREATRALGADAGGACLADPTQERLFPAAGYHVPRPVLEAFARGPVPLRGHRFFEEAWDSRRPVFSSDAAADPRIDHETWARFPHRSILFFPIVVREQRLGGLFVVWWGRSHRVTPEELRLVEGISRQAGLAIANARLHGETEPRRRETEVVAEIARTINTSLELDTVLQRVAEGARDLCGSDMARIALWDPASKAMIFRFWVGSRRREYEGVHVDVEKGAGGLVVATGRPFRAASYEDDPRITKDYLALARAEGVVAELVVPIRIGGRVEGLLYVDNRSARPFTDRDEAVLTQLADHAGIAITNARLYEETERRRRAAESLAELVRIISQSLHREEVEHRIAESLRALLGVQVAALYRLEPASENLVGLAVTLGESFGQNLVLPRGTGVAGLAVRERRPVVTPDLLADPRVAYAPEMRTLLEHAPFRAFLAVPLIVQDRVIGALTVGDRAGREFDGEDIRLAQTFADQAALALENARLFEETRERLRESETLREVSQVLSRNLPTDEAMRRVARAVGRAFQADMVGAYFLDARREALVPIGGYRVPKDRLETFLRTPFPLARFAFLGEAWESRRPVWTSDYARDPRFDQEFLGTIRPGALLFTPTPVRGEVAGGLFLVWWTPGRTFTPADLRLIEGVASQVGLALENADLARQTREKLLEAETLLSAARALSATLDLQPLLRRFLREVARTIECDSVGVWLANPASGHLEPFAGYHVPSVFLEPVRRTWIDLETTPFYAEAIARRRVVASSDVPGDPRIPASLKAVARHQTQLFAPIVVRDRLIGALLAVWWERAREFSDRELTLVEAMASQAGAAIENARLFQENQRKLEELSVLYELSRAVTGQLDVAELVHAIHREVGRVLDARNIAILFYDEERREFEVALRVLDGEADPNPDRRYRLGHGLMSVVVQRRQALRTSDYAETCRQEGVEPVRELLRFRNWLGVPMIAGDRVWGVLALRDAARPFTEADEQLLSNIASLAALAVRSARLYEERTRAYGELASAQEQLVRAEKLRALGEMAGGVAHDFNNMLAVILGRTQLLLRQAGDPALRRHLDVIQTVAMDGAQTVRRIQEVARMRRARPFQPVDLTAVVEEVVELTRSRWKDEVQARGHRVEVHVEARPVPEVAGDPAELREALTNLVFNALDAMPDGGRLALETRVEGEWVYCVIADTGVGMSEEVRRRIFDPFFTTKGERGTGLGLSVVYGIVTRHGGEIDVEGAPGRGSVFTIRLPVAAAAVTPGQPPSPRTRAGARILVVEDEPEVRDVLTEILEAQGHAVRACADGEAGVAQVRAESFDLVFTDLGMPGMSGWEVARLVKLERPGTPVALVTGWSDQIDPAEALGRGVDFLMAKPFETADVSVVVARALARGDRRPAEPAAG